MVGVPTLAVQELEKSINQGPMYDSSGIRMLGEAQVARINGLKIEIFSNEHPPPHFRVICAGETANYRISDCYQLNGGLNKWRKNIEYWHRQNKDLLIETWNALRPGNCPVGEYIEKT